MFKAIHFKGQTLAGGQQVNWLGENKAQLYAHFKDSLRMQHKVHGESLLCPVF